MSTVIQMPSKQSVLDSASPVHCVGVPVRSTTAASLHLSSVASVLALVDPPIPCKRTVVWFIDNVGCFCHVCYESYFAANWRRIEITAIHRLSDCEEDFFRG